MAIDNSQGVDSVLASPFAGDFVRESDGSSFRGVLVRHTAVIQRPGDLRQVGNYTLRTGAAVALDKGGIVAESGSGGRRFRVQYTVDDETGMVEHVLAAAV